MPGCVGVWRQDPGEVEVCVDGVTWVTRRIGERDDGDVIDHMRSAEGFSTWAGFVDLVLRLHAETPLAVNITTNGLRLRPDVLDRIAPSVGQLRLSMYDDNDWRTRVAELAQSDVRFGVNHLVTPRRLPDLEMVVLELVDLGCTRWPRPDLPRRLLGQPARANTETVR